MLYDRPYMRQQPAPPSHRYPAYIWLIGLTVGIFVLQQLLYVFFPHSPGGSSGGWIGNWLVLDKDNIAHGKLWTLVTYGFLHGNLLHILSNMLGLYFMARVLEPILGAKRFMQLYFTALITSGIGFLLVQHAGALYYDWNFQQLPPSAGGVVGASGAVFALLAYFCLLRWEQPITFLLYFIIPVTLKPKWIYWGSIGISALFMLSSELPMRGGMAHSAHLTGLLTGTFFFRLMRRGSHSFSGPSGSKIQIEAPEWFTKRRPRVQKKTSFRVNRSNKIELQKEVDRILDKINSSGFGSLSDDEKATLDRAKDILSR